MWVIEYIVWAKCAVYGLSMLICLAPHRVFQGRVAGQGGCINILLGFGAISNYLVENVGKHRPQTLMIGCIHLSSQCLGMGAVNKASILLALYTWSNLSDYLTPTKLLPWNRFNYSRYNSKIDVIRSTLLSIANLCCGNGKSELLLVFIVCQVTTGSFSWQI